MRLRLFTATFFTADEKRKQLPIAFAHAQIRFFFTACQYFTAAVSVYMEK